MAKGTLPFMVTMIGFAFGNLVFGRMIDRYGVVLCQTTAAFIALVTSLVSPWSRPTP